MKAWMQRLGPMLAVVMLLVSAYNLWTWTGLYRLFAEMQLRLPAESYDATFTFLLTYLAYLVACTPIFVALRRLSAGEAVDLGIDAWVQNNPASLVLGVGALGLLGTGAFFAVDALSMGQHGRADVATLESGADLPSRWVELHGGVALPHRARGISSDERTRMFIPVRGSEKQGFSVFLEVSERALDAPAPSLVQGPWQGVLYRNGLPGLVRADFADAGELADHHVVLRTETSPESTWVLASSLGFVGALFAVALAIVRWFSRRAVAH